MYMLKTQLGATVVKNTPVEWVITVPALWSDEAKDRTRKAALKATAIKNSHVHLVSEPEAAALYTLYCLDRHELQKHDTFVTVDAGGGTVDLISYTIKKLKPVLEVDEASPGDGGLCGSNFLNERFERRFREKLGHLQGFDEAMVAEARDFFETKVRRYVHISFRMIPNNDQVKRSISATMDPNFRFFVPVGGLAPNKTLGISKGKYPLLASEVREIFEPVVPEIIKLVKRQIDTSKGRNSKNKALLLVGGFGSSLYLRDRIRKAIGNGIEILQPPDAWSAVIRGAVLKGLAINSPEVSTVAVRKRKARKSYGFELSAPYDEVKHSHLKRTKFWSEEHGDYRVRVMHWFVKRVCIACLG